MTDKGNEKVQELVSLLKEAQRIASELGFINLFQPGLAKEIIIASMLGHKVHNTKREADAVDPDNPNQQYEYLSCWEGGTFQLDRMFKSPEDKKQKSLQRITRNACFYCVVFKKKSPLDVAIIFKVPTDKVLEETERQLSVSINQISHVGFTVKWARDNGEIVYKSDN